MGWPFSSWIMSREYQLAPTSGSEETSLRSPSGKPRWVHSVCPSGPTTATSLTGMVSKAACRIAATSPGRQLSTPRAAKPSSMAITCVMRDSASAIARLPEV